MGRRYAPVRYRRSPRRARLTSVPDSQPPPPKYKGLGSLFNPNWLGTAANAATVALDLATKVIKPSGILPRLAIAVAQKLVKLNTLSKPERVARANAQQKLGRLKSLTKEQRLELAKKNKEKFLASKFEKDLYFANLREQKRKEYDAKQQRKYPNATGSQEIYYNPYGGTRKKRYDLAWD